MTAQSKIPVAMTEGDVENKSEPKQASTAKRQSLFSRIKWESLIILTVSPIVGVYGAIHTPLQTKTLLFSVWMYFFSMLGITAGAHRLYSHRSYTASTPLQLFLLIGGASASQGSALWWAREHRAHHRYTDTDLDPHSANDGFFWTHMGWIIFRKETPPGSTDIRDLKNNKLVMFQHRHYFKIFPWLAFVLPVVIPGYFWGDWAGGLYYATLLRLTVVHHSIFCINSLAHWLGEAPFDDKHTPRNHLFTAVVTMGEGYHNFHHQFPVDYRNAIKWYQYDPTKWFIRASELLGLSTNLQTFPENEIKKGTLTMSLKKLRAEQDSIKWPLNSAELPVVDWETFQKESETTPLILINGYIHDVSGFEQKHPGGRTILMRHVGKDASSAFSGGVYGHSNAAHNLLAMMRVGILDGGVEHVKYVTPAERLRIVEQRKKDDVEPWSPITAK
ncbi:hypothetical protein DL769_011198 [Monosporascus sp. CRB-8-3]|nr:hypothetical protein DL769_011198 [Monosporascus sp. CRB-8-3]